MADHIDCRLPIADCRFDDSLSPLRETIGNRQLPIGYILNSFAAKLIQQWRERVDNLIVGDAVAGDQTIHVLNFRHVVV
jgi:hypothetical protein